MTKQLKLSALAAALLVSASAFAAKPGYLADQSTDSVVRNSYKECWHTTYFDKATQGLVECGDKVAEASAPAPEPTIVREKVVLQAKVLFGFDKSKLVPAAKDVLDPLVARLKDNAANLKGISVNGYTDFIGSDKYNLRLSQQRADSVRNYFVHAGIPADKITAVGNGKAGATMTETCTAKYKYNPRHRASAALKACTEPDRRVELVIDTVQSVTKN